MLWQTNQNPSIVGILVYVYIYMYMHIYTYIAIYIHYALAIIVGHTNIRSRYTYVGTHYNYYAITMSFQSITQWSFTPALAHLFLIQISLVHPFGKLPTTPTGVLCPQLFSCSVLLRRPSLMRDEGSSAVLQQACASGARHPSPRGRPPSPRVRCQNRRPSCRRSKR